MSLGCWDEGKEPREVEEDYSERQRKNLYPAASEKPRKRRPVTATQERGWGGKEVGQAIGPGNMDVPRESFPSGDVGTCHSKVLEGMKGQDGGCVPKRWRKRLCDQIFLKLCW